MSDKVIAITSLLLLIALLCRNWEMMRRIAELEERVDAIERKERNDERLY